MIGDEANPATTQARAHRSLWLRAAAWIAAGIVLLLVLLVASAALLLQSSSVHAYLLRRAEHAASARLGTRVSLQNFAVHFSTLTLDLYGLTIDGAPPYPQPPLLQVQHATIGVRIVSVLHRKWYLDTLRIDRPVVRVFAGADGSSNLPTLKTSGASHTSVFDLGIRHATLSGGVVEYNNRKSALTANLRDVDFHAGFDAILKKYSGELQYHDGVVQMKALRPIRHSLDILFSATPSRLHVERAVLSAGASSLTLIGELQNYGRPQAQVRYQLVASGAQAASILGNSSIPAGTLRSSGTITYQDQPGVAPLDALVLHGTLSSQALQVKLAHGPVVVRAVHAALALTGGNLSVSNLQARALGGSVQASYEMHDLSGPSRSQLTAKVRGLSLAQLKDLTQSTGTAQSLGIQGVLNGDASAAWGTSLAAVDLVANATANGYVSGQKAAPGPVPVQAALHAQYSGASQQITLHRSQLQLPSTSLVLKGTLGHRAGLTVQMHSSNLAELEDVADLVRRPVPGKPLTPLGLAGTASFQGVIRGTTAAPDIFGTISAQDVQILGTRWKAIHSGVEISPFVARLQHAELQPAQQGHIAADASLALHRWAPSAHSALKLHLDATDLQVAAFTPLLAHPVPVTGMLRVSAAVQGPLDQPVGHGSVVLTQAKIYGQPVRTARVLFTGTGSNILTQLEARVAGGSLTASADVQPLQRTYTAQLAINAVQLAKLYALSAAKTMVTGTVDAQGSGQGSFSDPQFDATLRIPQLAVQQQTVDNLQLHAWMQNHAASATLDSQAVGTYVQATAHVGLGGSYPARGTLNTHAIPLAPLFALFVPAAGSSLAGETEIHASFQGPLKDRRQMEAHITLPVLKLNYGTQIQLAATQHVQIDYQNQVLNLRRSSIRGTDTDLQFQGSVPIGSNAPVSLLMVGTVNLQLAQAFNADVRSSGQLRFDINSYGARTGPNVEGKVEIVNANYANGTLPIGLQHANGVLVLTRDRLDIQSFTATVGGGTVTAQGGVAYRPNLQFDLGVAATGVRLLYPEGVREELAANLRFVGNREDALLGGRVQVQDLSFTPQFDMTRFVGNLSGGVTPPPSQGFSQNVRLNVQVNSTNDLNPVSRALSVDGTANLQVRGTVAQPVILGRINLNGGDLIFNGNRFTLAGGTVEFVNPAETQPVVNVSLNTTIQQYDIHLRFNGPVDQIHTNYASDPALPAADIINLLAFGQTTEAAQANPVPGNQAAISAVASQVSSQITSRVAKIAGISQLSINPVLAGGTTQGPAGAIVTVQQRVTGNLFVTFSTNVTTTQDQVIMGQYNLSRRTSVSATRDQNGGFAFDTTFRRSW